MMARPSAPLIAHIAILIGGLLAWPCAHAAPPVAPRDHIPHVVVKGDTLEQLAQSYFGDANQWPVLQSINRVTNPRVLKPGSVLHIPVRLLPFVAATAEFVQGPVHLANAPAETVSAGQTLKEGALLNVGPDAFVSVRLADGSLVKVQADSSILLQQLRRRGRAGSLESIIEMHKGRLESSVPERKDALPRLEIRTPIASTSVRGTRFSVHTTPDGRSITAVVQGKVAVQSHTQATKQGTPVASGQGLAVNATGAVGTVQTLLPAPDLASVPTTASDPGFLTLPLPSVPSATAHEILLAQDADFTQVVRQGQFTGETARMRQLADGPYHISIRALDVSGIPGFPARGTLTVKTQPVPPLYQAPAPDGLLGRGQGELVCTSVPGVQWYRIDIARDAAFTDLVRSQDRLETCRMAVNDLATGSYFWRVGSIQALPNHAIDPGPLARAQKFTVSERPPALSSESLQQGGGYTLHWQSEAGQRFRLSLSRDMEAKQSVHEQELDAPRWKAPELPAGSYYVRIQTLDPSGLLSDWSMPRQITLGSLIQDGSNRPLLTSEGHVVERQ